VMETPEIQAALNLGMKVLGSLDTISYLEDHGDEHQGLLGVPLAEPDTEKFVAETLEKRFADPPLQDEVAVGGKLHHPLPSVLGQMRSSATSPERWVPGLEWAWSP